MGLFTDFGMHHLRLSLAALALVTFPPAAVRPHATLHQDAYIWQRVWTADLETALHQSNDFIDGWRVLAGETNSAGRLRAVHADWKVLRDSGRPITAVFRIDGAVPNWDSQRMVGDIGAALAGLRSTGLVLSQIEIDYDCGTAELPTYAHFLTLLRPSLNGLPLSITALPAWLESPALDNVLAQADQAVLQVHAVREPHAGLFDSALARQWVDEFALRTSRPFEVALPAYGTRVSWGPDGAIVAVDSEAPRLVEGVESAELIADPASVAGFLSDLRARTPSHLAGIAWFRLPTDADSRSWSLATWRAVIRDELPQTRLSVKLRASTTPGMDDVLLLNAGPTDAPLPASVLLPSGCAEADGVNGYALEMVGASPALEREENGLLHGHEARLIGWARCSKHG